MSYFPTACHTSEALEFKDFQGPLVMGLQQKCIKWRSQMEQTEVNSLNLFAQ